MKKKQKEVRQTNLYVVKPGTEIITIVGNYPIEWISFSEKIKEK